MTDPLPDMAGVPTTLGYGLFWGLPAKPNRKKKTPTSSSLKRRAEKLTEIWWVASDWLLLQWRGTPPSPAVPLLEDPTWIGVQERRKGGLYLKNKNVNQFQSGIITK